MRATRRRTMIPLRTPTVFRPCMSARRRGSVVLHSVEEEQHDTAEVEAEVHNLGREVAAEEWHDDNACCTNCVSQNTRERRRHHIRHSNVSNDGDDYRGRSDKSGRPPMPRRSLQSDWHSTRRRHALDGQDSIVAGRSDTDVNINMNSGMGRQETHTARNEEAAKSFRL